jgi:aerobic carbon-monoxide dehydrogenase medium subunit
MKPPPFSYHDPRTTADVVGLLGSLDNAKLLAGGQSLMPMLNMRYVLPDHVIDLNRVDGLSFIRERDGALEIGAMTRQRDIEFSDIVRKNCPLMHEAIAQVGHRQTRNRGTLGGSLCHLDPAAELVSVAAALDAKLAVTGKNGARSVDFAAFPVAYMTPAIELDELLTGITFPSWPAGHGYAFVEFARRHGDFAVVSAAVLIEEDNNGKVTRVAVTLGGLGPAPVRASEVERALIGEKIEEKRLREICETLRNLDALDDIHAPASYRQQLATVLSRRALLKAHERIATRTRS